MRLQQSLSVAVCVNQMESDIPVKAPEGAVVKHIEILREIAPWHDLVALLKLWRFYRRRGFDAVLTVTPKGGLLGMMSARLAGVPVRLHWFTGQVWATRKGLMRATLKSVDQIIAACATHVLADSPSQRDFLVRERVVPAAKISVLGQGSISGVDTARFRPDAVTRERVRNELRIPEDAVCLLYVGRMKKEKGVADLLRAFGCLRAEFPMLHLLLVGPDEEGLIVGADAEGLHVVGYTNEVEIYMAAADIICLPSYREGFGSVLIEGAACGLPAVASRIYGVTDAVVENVTGLLHPPGDVAALGACLQRLLADDRLRSDLGRRAHKRALDAFESSRVEEALDRFLHHLLQENTAGAGETYKNRFP